MKKEILEAILSRRSVRGFDSRALEKAQEDELVRCALASPTAMNRRAWHFSVVKNAALLGEMEREMVTRIESGGDEGAKARMAARGGKIFYSAPMVVFITVDPGHTWCEVDAGIAVENLALAAKGMGLDSCIIGMVKSLFESPDAEIYQKIGAPEGYVFAIAIAIGHPVTQPDPPEKPGRPVTVIE